MTNQTLLKARQYEETFGNAIVDEDRPAFHLSPRTGWMNDPNGFSWYGGKYHLFYQYHPYNSYWGPMHWGHAVSGDLLHWEYLPAALAPDEAYDRDGCFSGSALTLPDGRQLLIYTGVIKERLADGGCNEVQTQCLAVGDGVDYMKYENNPVLDGKDLPENASRYDFRDPKIWQEQDGSYRCVVGNLAADGSGQILLFSSMDGFAWQYAKILAANRGRFGRMWECPDFFPLDGRWLLVTSPQDMLASGLEYPDGGGTLCLIGDYDRTAEDFRETSDQPIDCGIDFYAPQTMLAPDGRRLLIGWLQNWDTCAHRRKHDEAWFGQMSLPRELSIRNGRLFQQPVRELLQMRSGQVSHENVIFSGVIGLAGIKGRRIDMEVAIRPKEGHGLYRKFTILLAQNEMYHTSLSFLPQESTLEIDRTSSGFGKAVIHQRRSRVKHTDGQLKLRIILDRFSVEVFVNDGEQVLSAVLYTDQNADGISFLADGTVHMDVVKYNL